MLFQQMGRFFKGYIEKNVLTGGVLTQGSTLQGGGVL